MHRFWRLLATLALGTVLWAGMGYLVTMPLGMLFGWSGHPAMPAAPVVVYVLVYCALLPAFSLWGAWHLVSRFTRTRT